MKNLISKKDRSLFADWAPLLLLVFLLGVTAIGWRIVDGSVHAKAESSFLEHWNEISSKIKMRFQEHEKILRGGVGLFNSVGEVSRAQWRQYVAALELDQNHPGIQGMGFSSWIQPAEKMESIRRIRAEGFPDYNIRPEGERSIYTSVIYLEPFNWRNQRVFGFDMYTEPVRRKAVDQAIDQGVTTITSKITLIQETETDKQNGLLMYVPVYKTGRATDTAEARRRAIRGFVYSPICMKDFISAVLGNEYDDLSLEFSDEGSQLSDKTLFNSVSTPQPNQITNHKSLFDKTDMIEVFNGRLWRMHLRSLPAFEKSEMNNEANLVLVLGVALSLLLSFLSYSIISARKEALLLVEEKTQELKTSESSLRAIHDNSPLGIVHLDSKYRFISANPAFVELLGYSEEELKKISVFEVTHPDDQLKTLEVIKRFPIKTGELVGFEKRYVHKSGKAIWGRVSSRAVKLDASEEVTMFSIVEDVTNFREKEQLLKAAEDRSQILLKNASDGLHVLDASGNIVEVSDSFCQMLGYTQSEMMAMNATSWDAKLSKAQLAQAIHEVFSQGAIARFETRHRCKNGKIIDVEISVKPLALGEQKALCCSARDISERKQLETALRSGEQKLQAVLSSSEVAIAWANGKLEIEYVNPKFTSLFGYRLEEVATIEKWYHCAYPEADYRRKTVSEWDAKVAKSIPTKSAVEPMEVDITCKDGAVRTVLIMGSWFGDNLLANFSDITERKKMEDQLRIFSTLIEQSPVAVVITDLAANIQYANPRFLELNGYSKAEVIGKNPRILKSEMTPKDRYLEMWKNLKEGRSWHGELINRKKNGKIYWEEAVIAPVKNAKGANTNYVAIEFDVTDRKRIEEQNTVLQEQVIQSSKWASIGVMIAGIAHEINNPLAIIGGNIERLRMRVAKGKQRETLLKLLDQQEAAVKRSAKIVTDMLELSNPSHQTVETIDLHKAILAVIASCESEFQSAGLALEGLLKARKPLIKANSDKIQQIINGLLSNAKNACEGVNTGGKVIIETSDQGSLVEVRISDNGSGIAKENLTKIFDPFFTTQPPGKGVGLGLSVAQSYVRLFGGTISVESEPGFGTRFTIRIPSQGFHGKISLAA